jgi:hypothetical protein
MSLFNSRKAIEGLSEKITAHKSQGNPVLAAVADLKAENERLRSRVGALSARVDEHDSKFADQDCWNVEAENRVKKAEGLAMPARQRQCPGCSEMRNDGPESFPGYLEAVARAGETAYHEWRQLCAWCRSDREPPQRG